MFLSDWECENVKNQQRERLKGLEKGAIVAWLWNDSEGRSRWPSKIGVEAISEKATLSFHGRAFRSSFWRWSWNSVRNTWKEVFLLIVFLPKSWTTKQENTSIFIRPRSELGAWNKITRYLAKGRLRPLFYPHVLRLVGRVLKSNVQLFQCLGVCLDYFHKSCHSNVL